jgi:UDP-N-acetylmuramate--alanine ligase
MDDLPPPSPPASAGTAHLVGIAGSGMKGLAELLVARGWRVSGSDPALESQTTLLEHLRAGGVRLFGRHAAENVPTDADVLVHSAAVPTTNPERLAANAKKTPERTYSQMVGRLMQSSRGVCVAGTHGKSTTTALVGWILEALGERPDVIVGAEFCHTGRNGWAGSGEWLVAESCEFQRSFLDFAPKTAAILSIEPDHFDCYGSLDEIVTAFREFATKIDARGSLVIPFEDPVVARATVDIDARLVTFGLIATTEPTHPRPDWWAVLLPDEPGALTRGERFEWGHGDRSFGTLTIPLFGLHNVRNVLAAIALVASAREDAGRGPLDSVAIEGALRTFPGLRRRFEVICDTPRIVLVDDYAHHPTELLAALSGARRAWPGRPLVVAFQGHQISRTKALLDDFAAALARADRVVVTPIFAAREQGGEACLEWGERLANRVRELGTNACFVPSLDHVPPTLDDPGSVPELWMTLGAGDIHRTHHALARRIQRHHDAG